MSDAFWSGRRVLVTGHTGFKGSWLALWLQSMGARVAGLALDPEHPAGAYEALQPWEDLDDHRVDLTDGAAVARVVEIVQPEIVFHLGAQSLVRRGYARPVETYAVNVLGTAHLLAALQATGSAIAAVVATTDKVYAEPPPPGGYREQDQLGAHDPYSASKACAELLVSSWRSSAVAGPRLATVRAGNVIGGGDTGADRLVPDVVQALLAGTPPALRNPAATRPWQFVLEPLRAYLMLAQRMVEGGEHPVALNVGPPVHAAELPVAALVELLARQAGSDTGWVLDESPNPREAAELRLDPTLALETLGWEARLDLATGLAWTLEWYQGQRQEADMRPLSLRQLERYREIADS